jgi:protein-S-isoprenylcysteine O-methyltransferase Ste14
MVLLPPFKFGVWNAWLFMSVFLFQMMAIMFVDKRIREKSHVPGDARRQGFERSVGIIGNYIWLIALGYSVFLPLQFGTLWFIMGLAIFAIGLVLMTVATYNFISTPASVLISKGVYRFSRHPMYLATALICLGSGIAAASWIFIVLTAGMIACFRQEALIEERFCVDKYGSEYQEYMDRVPRWFGMHKRI